MQPLLFDTLTAISVTCVTPLAKSLEAPLIINVGKLLSVSVTRDETVGRGLRRSKGEGSGWHGNWNDAVCHKETGDGASQRRVVLTSFAPEPHPWGGAL